MDKVTTTPMQASSEVRVPRRFSTKYKLDILTDIEAASETGEVGQILRWEGLYSSLISQWRKQRERGALQAMSAKQRGPKTNKLAAENRRLRERLAHLEERLVLGNQGRGVNSTIPLKGARAKESLQAAARRLQALGHNDRQQPAVAAYGASRTTPDESLGTKD